MYQRDHSAPSAGPVPHACLNARCPSCLIREASLTLHPCPPAAVAVVGCCLFPLAPNWTKVAVFYATAGLLALILGVLALRRLVGGAVLC